MKYIVFTFVGLILFSVVNAQRPFEKRQHNFLKKNKANQFPGVKIPRDSILNNSYAFNQNTIKFLFENNKGKVYESQIDNMRILVPTFNSNMPVLKLYPNKLQGIKPVPIPNALPKAEIIPIPIQ